MVFLAVFLGAVNLAGGWIQEPAVAAGPLFFTSVESIEHGTELCFDVCEQEIFFIEKGVAFLAIPEQAVFFSFQPFTLNYKSDSIFEPLRGMRYARRKQENLTLANIDVSWLALFEDLKGHVTFDLVEKLGTFLVVIIRPAVWSAHDHADKVAFFPNNAVTHGRLQLMAVLLDPFLEINRRKDVTLAH